jgi:hypothetical protein
MLKFCHGVNLPDTLNTQYPVLYIVDDLMKDATRNVDVCELFTEGSHHCNLSVICLMQNLYYRGKENRTMNLNSQYLVLFKNPRDQQQVAILARQMYPNNSKEFMLKFQVATEKPYGYLLVDLKQETAEGHRLKPNPIIPKTINTDDQINCNQFASQHFNEMDQKFCTDCGLVFTTPMYLHNHIKKGCSENYQEQSMDKNAKPIMELINEKYDIDDEENIWDDLLKKAWDKNNKLFQAKANEYMENGLSEKKAREKASTDMERKYAITLMEIYKEYVLLMHHLYNDKLHQEIMASLLEGKETSFQKALNDAVHKHRTDFTDIVITGEEAAVYNINSEESQSDSSNQSFQQSYSQTTDENGSDENM